MIEPFRYDAEVDPGETRYLRFEVSETYLGDPVEIPITVINGEHDGPRVCVTAAIHGDELNGVKAAQEVADTYDPAELHGTLVVVHVCNVPGYQAQQRYIPIYDQDMNRSFPGRQSRTPPDGWPTRSTAVSSPSVTTSSTSTPRPGIGRRCTTSAQT